MPRKHYGVSLIGLIICKKCKLPVAEKEGFEPSRQSPQPTPLAGEPLTATWVLLHGIRFYAFTHLAEREGFAPAAPPPITPGRLKRATDTLYRRRRTLPFESHHSFLLIWRRERDSNPRCLATSLVFKTSSINHSDISPRQLLYYSKGPLECQAWLILAVMRFYSLLSAYALAISTKCLNSGEKSCVVPS